MIRGALAAHGDRGDLGPWAAEALWRGLIMEQFKTQTIGQLQIEQHQVVMALSQEGAGPAQAVGFFDHAAWPGILEDHARTQPMHRVIIDHEQSRGSGGGHVGVPKWCGPAMTPLPAATGNPVFWVVTANLLKYWATEERCSLQPIHQQARLGSLSNCAHPLTT